MANELKKIEYDEALKHLNILNNFVIMWCDEIDLDYHDTYKNNYQKVKKAIEEATEQEKLLSLYKKLSNYVDEQTYSHELPEITQLKIKIKELEKEGEIK